MNEKQLCEEFAKYTSSEDSDISEKGIADWWLQKIAEQKKELVEMLMSEIKK